MKIAILKNKGVNDKFVEKEIENLKYFSNINKNFALNNIPYTVTVIETDFDVKIKQKGKAKDGQTGYTLKSLPEIPLGYDFVAIMYDGVPMFKKNTGNFAYSRREPINGSFITEIPDGSNDHVLPHELMHLIGKKLKSLGHSVIDQMDSTIVDGQLIPYYKNNVPESHLGNYHVTLLSYNPFTKYLNEPKDFMSSLPKAVLELIKSFLAINAAKKPKYKNFSELEVKGLEHEFVLLLDKARDIAGIPFVINSGFRTPEHNKRVGGVANSAHLSGLAVDLRARTGAETYGIIKAAMEVGIKRIGINRAKHFVHLDINYSDKPYPTIYEY